MPEARSFDAVVVGAGVAGLFCATALADAGLRVCVLDGAAVAGGRARSWQDAATGTDVDIGPHVVSTEHLNFLRMLERLGTAGRIAWQPDTLVDLFDAGEVLKIANIRWPPPLHGLPNVPVALRRLSIRDALSHTRVSWRAARENEHTLRELDAQDAASYLRAMRVTEHGITWFWRSAMLALLNVPLEECSAAAAMRVFRLMLGRSGYHFGFPRTGLSDLYVPACTEAIHAGGGEVITGAVVHSLHIEGGACRGVRLRDGTELRAPTCVLAAAPWHAAPLLARTGDPPLASLQQAARAFRGAPYISTMLWLDRQVTDYRFWARVWNPADLNTDFYDLSNVRPELAGSGSLIACNAIGPNVRWDWSDAQVIARTRAELEEFAPEARGAALRHARVHRIRAAIPQPRPGTELQRPGTRTEVQGLFVAGDWTDTAVPCSMESAARSAALTAEAILGETRALPPPETYGLVGLLRSRRKTKK